MTLSALLIPVLCGYWVLTRSEKTRYWIFGQTGYHLFFNSALVGVVLLLFSWPVSVLVAGLKLGWEDMSFYDFPVDLLTILFCSLIAVLTPLVLNWRNSTSPNELAKEGMFEDGDLIAWVLQDALPTGSLVEITTKHGKSYIGSPQLIQPPRRPGRRDTDIALLPVFSGYRKPDTRELVLTSDYRPILKFLEARGPVIDDLSAENLLIALRYGEIVSARRFNTQAYRFLNSMSRSARKIIV